MRRWFIRRKNQHRRGKALRLLRFPSPIETPLERFMAEIEQGLPIQHPELHSLYLLPHSSISGVFNIAMVEKTGANPFIQRYSAEDLAQAVLMRIRDLNAASTQVNLRYFPALPPPQTSIPKSQLIISKKSRNIKVEWQRSTAP